MANQPKSPKNVSSATPMGMEGSCQKTGSTPAAGNPASTPANKTPSYSITRWLAEPACEAPFFGSRFEAKNPCDTSSSYGEEGMERDPL